MKNWLYDISIWGYKQGIRVAAPFNGKANLFREGRRNWKKNLKKQFEKNTAPVAWFHCASLGEFEQGRPLIEDFKSEYPHYKILLTFFSPSGFKIRKNYDKADFVTYLPLDTKKNAAFFIKTVKPKIVFFIKYEFWYYFIEQIWKQKIPLLSISTIFRANQHFFRNKKTKTQKSSFSLRMLERFTYFFVQNEESQTLLNSVGIKNTQVTGDTRFDRVQKITESRKELPVLEKFLGQNKLLVVGSSWQEDIEVLTPAFKNFRKAKKSTGLPVKMVIAPHEIKESNLKKIEKAFDYLFIKRYSLVQNASKEELENTDILLIDNIGLLSSIYSYGYVAYVGGAFGKGLHNILEAATFGMPILFGNKNYQKFQEATDLIQKRGAFAVSDSKELEELFLQLFYDDYFREQINEITRAYVTQNTGATQKIITFCKQTLTS